MSVSVRRRYGRHIVDELTEILIKARDGDAAALAGFVRHTQPSLWRFCAHLAGPADADDATQETYLACWQALPHYRGESSARTWLYVIARRTAERVAGRRRRWQELAANAPGPSARSEAGWAIELDEMLSVLSEEQRLVLLLTQVVGLSYAEAAEVCDCPVGTIRSRLARARNELVQAWRRDDLDVEAAAGRVRRRRPPSQGP